MRLSVQINNNKKGKELAKFLRTIEYIKSVDIEDTSLPLSDEDWLFSGRPATEEEVEQLASEMEIDKGGIEANKFFSALRKKIR